MKCCVFVHRKLSGVQVGIQALHAVARLSLSAPAELYNEWAMNHETVVVLDGGHCKDLLAVTQHLNIHCIDYASFREEDFNDQITAVAMIVDDTMIRAQEALKDGLERTDNDYLMFDGRLDIAEYLLSFRTHRG